MRCSAASQAPWASRSNKTSSASLRVGPSKATCNALVSAGCLAALLREEAQGRKCGDLHRSVRHMEVLCADVRVVPRGAIERPHVEITCAVFANRGRNPLHSVVQARKRAELGV